MRNQSEVIRVGMADCYSGIGVSEHESHGCADNIGTPDDDSSFAIRIYSIFMQQLHDSGRRAWNRATTLMNDVIDHIKRMEAVHVFFRVDSIYDIVSIDVRWKRELYQDSVILS